MLSDVERVSGHPVEGRGRFREHLPPQLRGRSGAARLEDDSRSSAPASRYCRRRVARVIFGYARVWTDAQDLTSQLAQLKSAGRERLFREKISGLPRDCTQVF
jgi:hypothetical protein